MVSLPNILCCVLAGFFLDFAGMSNGGLIFTFVTVVGLVLFAVSAGKKDFEMALVARAIYGIGAEC